MAVDPTHDVDVAAVVQLVTDHGGAMDHSDLHQAASRLVGPDRARIAIVTASNAGLIRYQDGGQSGQYVLAVAPDLPRPVHSRRGELVMRALRERGGLCWIGDLLADLEPELGADSARAITAGARVGALEELILADGAVCVAVRSSERPR